MAIVARRVVAASVSEDIWTPPVQRTNKDYNNAKKSVRCGFGNPAAHLFD
jgi:hypothetical protein